MEFAKTLFELRRGQGLSQEELATKIGVSRQAVSKWETGEAMPDLNKLLSLKEALDVSLDELCGLGETAAEKRNGICDDRKAGRGWKGLCAVLLVIVILLSIQVVVLKQNETAGIEAIETEVIEATFYSSTGHSLRYSIAPRSVNSDYTYYLLLTPETPVSGAPKKPIALNGSSGIFQGELTFPLTASRWDVSLQVEGGGKTYLIPVATDVYYKAEGMVSWENIE